MKFTQSYWLDSTPATNYPTLKVDTTLEIVVIGGGIVGITTALLLQKEGCQVALLEGNRIIQGTSGYTTAKITAQHNLIYAELINTFGREKAQQYGDANQKALNFIENTIKNDQLSCDFQTLPAYVYTTEQKYVAKIEEEVTACQKLGLKAGYYEDLPLALPIKAAIQLPEQAQFHPRKYLLALAEKFAQRGGVIYENSRIVEVEKNPAPILTTAAGYKIKCERVIIASHFPCYDGLGFYFTRLRPERSYLVGLTAKDKFPPGMFISAEKPIRSLRCQKYGEGELILLGGEGHRTGHGQETGLHYQALNKFGHQLFSVEQGLYQWSTQDYITLDQVPYIGKLTSSNKNIYLATGFGKWGMSGGTSAALILRDLIINGSSPYEQLFSPSRNITAGSVKNFMIENLDTSKEFIKGKIKGGEEKALLGRGKGQVVQIEGEKYGGYRDPAGKLHLVDITCPHLGCELTWNSAERTWDCPCHGSRFNFKGKIIEGPALQPLKYFPGKAE